MKTLLFVVGMLACLVGLVWIGQGTGYFPYPARSFMINETSWAYRGGIVFAVGLMLIWVARRR
jgi:hypothetical protein